MKKEVLLSLLLVIVQIAYSQKADNTLLISTDTLKEASPERFRIRKLYIPAALVTVGIVLNGNGCEAPKHELVEERNEHLAGFHTRIDDYLQFSPIAVAYGLDALGVKSGTDIRNRTAILLKGELGMFAVTHLMKNVTKIQRPDQSGYVSFPSGHTAQAFAAATFLGEEYRHRIKWMPYAAYGVATSVGILRMANNKHYISDVLVGAGIGFLSMKLSYWTHRYKWGKRKDKPKVTSHSRNS